MHFGYRRQRPSLGEQWRSYGNRSFAARWAARTSLVVGVTIVVAVMCAAGALAVRLLWHLWLWLWSVV